MTPSIKFAEHRFLCEEQSGIQTVSNRIYVGYLINQLDCIDSEAQSARVCFDVRLAWLVSDDPFQVSAFGHSELHAPEKTEYDEKSPVCQLINADHGLRCERRYKATLAKLNGKQGIYMVLRLSYAGPFEQVMNVSDFP